MSGRPSPSLVASDIVAVVALGLVALSPLHAAYGGTRWLLAAAAGLVVGLVVAIVSAIGRWGPWTTALGLAVGYLVFGAALAVPDHAAARVLPGPDALRALALGIVNAWRDSLTLMPPLGSGGIVLIVPWATGLIGGVVCGLILWRTRRGGLVVAVVLGLFVLAAAFGDVLTSHTMIRGTLLVIGLLLWSRWRSQRHVRASWGRRVVLATATIAVVSVATAGLAVVTTDDSRRDVLREHVTPPFDPQDHPSPLSRFRVFTDPERLKTTELFRVEGVDPGTRVRIATMDDFDGIVWNVTGGAGKADASGTFTRPRQIAGDDTHEVSITVLDYAGVWVPSVGETRSVQVLDEKGKLAPGLLSHTLYNEATGTVAQVGGVRTGATWRYRVELPRAATESEIAAAMADQSVRVGSAPTPESLANLVTAWLNDGAQSDSDGGRAALVARKFTEGFYSDGLAREYPSNSGHGLKRLGDLTADPREMVGNDEQYAAALGVVLQNLGLPARVVLGAEVPAGGVVRGDDVHAWVEVRFDDLGWVDFLPTPDDERKLQTQDEEPDPQPQPYVPQPPQAPEEVQQADPAPPQGAGDPSGGDLWAWLGVVLAIVMAALKVLLVLAPLWLLLLYKWRRRRRRRRAASPVVRLSGGWREVTDRARDLGARLPYSNTMYESSLELDERFPEANTPALATVAGRHVFGPGDPTDEEVDAYWTDVETALARMRKSVPWWRRPLALLSPASIPWRAFGQSARARAVATGRRLAASGPVRRLRTVGTSTTTKLKRRKKASS